MVTEQGHVFVWGVSDFGLFSMYWYFDQLNASRKGFFW
jgi:hypothetical protein